MKMKKIRVIILSVIMTFSMIPAIAFAGEEESEIFEADFVYTNTGVTATIDGDTVACTESGSEQTYAGSEFSLDGTTVTIDAAGEFSFSGTCNNGNIYVAKGETPEGEEEVDREIEINLEGLTLTEPDEGQCPIECKGGTNKVEISAKDGTVNTLTDANHNETSPKACINASKKLKLKGKGTLNVNGNNKNGIKSDKKVEIQKLNLNVNSVDDGIKSDTEIEIKSGNIVVNAGNDAIAADEHMLIGVSGEAGPTIDVQKSYEGLESTVIDIYSGDTTVRSNDDAVNSANKLTAETNAAPPAPGRADSACQITVYGGSVDAVGGLGSEGDCFDSNGDITLLGGFVSAFSSSPTASDALDCDGALLIKGATVFSGDQNRGFGMTSPAANSQKYVMYSKNYAAGSTIDITDNGTKTTYIIPIAVGHVMYSSPTLGGGTTPVEPIEPEKPTGGSSSGGNSGGSSESENITTPTEPKEPIVEPEPIEPEPIVMTTPKIKKLIAGKKSFTIRWKKVADADGYRLQYSTTKTFKKGTRKTLTISKNRTYYKVKNLKPHKKYYVRMRSFKVVDKKKKYSAWSSFKAIMI